MCKDIKELIADSPYARMIDTARKENSKNVLSNQSILHAAVVMYNMLILGREKKLDANLSTGTLHKDCYDYLCAEVKKFLDSGRKLDVFITDPEAEQLKDNAFLGVVENHKNANVFMRNSSQGEGEPENIPHFIEVGGLAYRAEHSHKTGKATLSFNRPDFAQKIKDYADRIRLEFHPYKANA